MKNTIPVALQLYSIRNDCAERGLPAVLHDVAEMGYEGVEFAGLHNLSARETRRHLDDLNLRVAGAHFPLADFLPDRLESTIELNRELGNRYLICPALPAEYHDSLDSWERAADLFNQIADRLARENMRLGFHNHTIEFLPVDGVLPWDIFFQNARPEIIMQIDTGNALAAGVDAAEFVEKYPNRSTTIHLKEFATDTKSAVLGEGLVNWSEILRLAETAGGTEWLIVEQESHSLPPLECVKRCLENLRRLQTSA